MKGIAHFAAGVAVASFFPSAVSAAAEGNALYLLSGAVFGLLPDTLDFKFVRYLCRHDLEIAPDPLKPDATMIANALAASLAEVHANKKSVCIKLHTVRMRVDRWLSYRIEIDRARRTLSVEFGDTVDSGGNSVGALERPMQAKVQLPVDLVMDYGAIIDVGFLEGPTLLLKPGNGCVESVFIHWHRAWSHSLALAVVCGAAMSLLAGYVAGLIALFALVSHIVIDQAGFMGGSFLYPFSRERKAGKRIVSSSDTIGNFAAVWLSGAIVLWNLGCSETVSAGLAHYLIWAGALPVLTAGLLLRR